MPIKYLKYLLHLDQPATLDRNPKLIENTLRQLRWHVQQVGDLLTLSENGWQVAEMNFDLGTHALEPKFLAERVNLFRSTPVSVLQISSLNRLSRIKCVCQLLQVWSTKE